MTIDYFNNLDAVEVTCLDSKKNNVTHLTKRIKYSDYEYIKDCFPTIYLGDGIEVEVSDVEGFLFFPNFDNSENEKCYIEHMDPNDTVDVIVKTTVFHENNIIYDKLKTVSINTNVKPDSKTYIMLDSNTGMYKIGKSINPRFREKTLQSEKPTIDLLLFCNNDVESELHWEYDSKRFRGEWFELTPDDILDIIDKYKFHPNESLL